MNRKTRPSLFLHSMVGAIWFQFILVMVASADDCGRYLKNPITLLTAPRSVLEDCARTPYAQAILTGIAASVAGGLIAAALGNALAQAAAQSAAGQPASPTQAPPSTPAPSTTVPEIYKGEDALKILEKNGLVKKTPQGYVPTDKLINWANDPLAGNIPLTGSRTVGTATDLNGNVTDKDTVQITSLEGAAHQPFKSGKPINPEDFGIIVKQTEPSGWQPVATPPPPIKDTPPPIKDTPPPIKDTPPPTTVVVPPKPKPSIKDTPPPPTTVVPPPKQGPPPEEIEIKRQELKKSQQESAAAQKTADRLDFWTNVFEKTESAADVSIDWLSALTGQVGKTVKTCYTVAKGLGKGLGEGMVDGDYAKHLGERSLESVVDLGIGKVSDKITDWGGGKIPGWFKRGPNPDDVLPKSSEYGMGRATPGQLKNLLSGSGEIATKTQGIVRDRIKDATLDAGQGIVRKNQVEDPLKKSMGFKVD